MNKHAIIVAGGYGQRMGSTLPKQFLEVKGKPLLYYTLMQFLNAYEDLQVILVLPNDYIEVGKTIVATTGKSGRVNIVAGGQMRFHSVQQGLLQVIEPSIIFVHDGVRCLVSQQLIRACYNQALQQGSAIPSVAATDSVRINGEATHSIIDRNKVRLIQTPQTFQSRILLPAYRQPFDPSFTDEATVVEAFGQQVYLIEGEYDNIKITRPVDLIIAEKLLNRQDAS